MWLLALDGDLRLRETDSSFPPLQNFLTCWCALSHCRLWLFLTVTVSDVKGSNKCSFHKRLCVNHPILDFALISYPQNLLELHLKGLAVSPLHVYWWLWTSTCWIQNLFPTPTPNFFHPSNMSTSLAFRWIPVCAPLRPLLSPLRWGEKPQLPSHTHKLIATICLSHKCRCENRQSRLIVKTNHSIWVWKVGFHRTKMFFVLGHVHSWTGLNIYICRSDELSRRPLFWMCARAAKMATDTFQALLMEWIIDWRKNKKTGLCRRFGLCWDQLLPWKWFYKCLLKWSECADTTCFNFTMRITVETEMQMHWPH